jgi:hypothetical protein
LKISGCARLGWIDEVANVIALFIGHRCIVTRGARLLAADMGSFADIGVVAYRRVVGEMFAALR